MSTTKSEKELAFLKDLYVSTDWSERFATIIDANIKVPKKGRVLYVEIGTGNHAMALQEEADNDVRFVCVDESEENLELARAKSIVIDAEPEFRRATVDSLGLRDSQFDLVIGDGSMVAPDRLDKMLFEMVRVAMPGAQVALTVVTATSFGEVFSLYWEALHSVGLQDRASIVEKLIIELPTVSYIDEKASEAGLTNVSVATQVEEFDYESGEDFMNSPLITDFLLPRWLEPLPEAERARITAEISKLIDEEGESLEFTFSVKFTVLTGKKVR